MVEALCAIAPEEAFVGLTSTRRKSFYRKRHRTWESICCCLSAYTRQGKYDDAVMLANSQSQLLKRLVIYPTGVWAGSFTLCLKEAGKNEEAEDAKIRLSQILNQSVYTNIYWIGWLDDQIRSYRSRYFPDTTESIECTFRILSIGCSVWCSTGKKNAV